MATRSLTHRFGIDRSIIFTDRIAHGALCIIHRTGNHTDKRNRHVVKRHIVGTGYPFHIFQTMNAFIVDHVRISTLQTCRFTDTMIIDHHLIFRTSFGSSVEEVDDLLVVAIHKVYLESFHTHIGIMLHHLFHIPVECMVARPEDDSDILGFAIIHQFRNIDFWNNLHQVRSHIDRPTFIENHIFDAMFGSEVDIIFIGFSVDTGTEIHIVNVPVIPPIPCHLTRFHPGNILQTAGRSQTIHHIAIGQLLVILRDDKHTPRESTRAACLGYVIFAFFH